MRDSKARLLLVEDNPVLQAALLQSLGPLFDVRAVLDTADAAIAWLDQHPDDWDLAIIDIFLKGGNGFRVLRRCVDRQPWQDALVLSNYTREPARSSAMELGASAVFDKSFEMEEFIAWCAAKAQAHGELQLCSATSPVDAPRGGRIAVS